MDTLSIIILTAVINAFVTAAIGGIILYRIQKKIDNSYFEHQTKFVRNHQKQVETLETLYKKFSIIADDFIFMLQATLPTEKHKINFPEFQHIRINLEDFRSYFVNNHLYLNSDISDEIQDIYKAADFLSTITQHLFLMPEQEPSKQIELANIFIKSLYEVDVLDFQNPKYSGLIAQMVWKMQKQTKILEALYKSVADTPTTN